MSEGRNWLSASRRSFFIVAMLFLGSFVLTPSAVVAAGSNPPIIFVPGFFGSQLVNNDGSVAFGNASTILNFRQLALPLDRAVKVRPSGIIRTFGIGPVSTSVYEPFIKALEQLGYRVDEDLFLFSYDWRLSARTNASLLYEFVEKQPKLNGKRLNFVTANSGGLVVESLLRDQQYARLIERTENVIEAGTPFFGSLQPFTILSDGLGATFNLLAGGAESVRSSFVTFPSIYELLPRYDNCCFVGDVSSTASVPFDSLDLEGWRRNLSWSFSDKPESMEFVAAGLADARKTRRILAQTWPASVRRFMIAGDRFETRTRVYINVAEKRITYSTGPGDGAVPFFSAASGDLPSVRLSNKQQDQLLSDELTLQTIRAVVVNAGAMIVAAGATKASYSAWAVSLEPQLAVPDQEFKVLFSVKIPSHLTADAKVSAILHAPAGDTTVQLEKKTSEAEGSETRHRYSAAIKAPPVAGSYPLDVVSSLQGSPVEIRTMLLVTSGRSEQASPLSQAIAAEQAWRHRFSVVRLNVQGEGPQKIVGEKLANGEVVSEKGIGIVVNSKGETLTVQHVVGADLKWKVSENGEVIGRRIFVDLFKIDGVRRLTSPITSGVELAASGVDLAAMTLFGQEQFEAVREFNTCPLKVTEPVTVLLWRDDIQSPEPVFGTVKPASSKYPSLIRAGFQNKLKRGDSGSPVFDPRGRLVGLVARLDEDDPMIGFIVPIGKAARLIQQKIEDTKCD